MDNSLRILLIDDHPEASAVVLRELNGSLPNLAVRQIAGAADFTKALESEDFELVITEYLLSWGNGLEVSRAVKDRKPDCPVILFTGMGSEEVAVEAMKAGLNDYVIKSPQNYSHLLAAIRSTLEKSHQHQAPGEGEVRYRALIEGIPVGVYRTSPQGRIIEGNPALVEMLGARELSELMEIDARKFYVDPKDRLSWRKKVEQRGIVRGFETRLRRLDGKIIWVRDSGRSVCDSSGKILCFEGTLEDITERRRGEAIQAATYQISEAVHSAGNLDELYRSIHAILGELMPADNFFIAHYDSSSDTLSFPYFVDQFDDPPAPQKPGKGLTAYVLRTRRPLLAGLEDLDQLLRSGVVESMGAASLDWLGVPLIAGQHVVGVMALQSYTEGIRYGEKEKDILIFVSNQVAMAIERKRTEQALKENEEGYRLLFQNSPVGVFHYDVHLHITDCNDRFVNILQSRRELLIGLDMGTLQDQSVLPALRKALEGEEGFYEGFYHATTGKAEVWVSMHTAPILNENGGIKGGVGIVEDISERKYAEIEFVRLAAVVEQAAESIVITNLDGSIIYVNPFFERLTGYSKAEALGENPRILKSGYQGREFYQDLWNTILSGETWSGTLINRRKDGSLYHEDATLFPIRDPAGEIINYAAVKKDITERVQREREMQAIIEVSSALRMAPGLDKMFPVILDQLLILMNAGSAAVALRDPRTRETVFELGTGDWLDLTGNRLPPGEGVSGYVMNTGDIYLSPDVREDARFVNLLKVDRDHAVVIAPLLAQGRTVGVLWVGREMPYMPAEVRLLVAVADIAANAIHRATLHEQTRIHAEQMAAVGTIGRALSETLDLSEIYERLARAIDALFSDIAAVFISLYDPEEKLITFVYGLQSGEKVNVAQMIPHTLEEPGIGTQSEVIRTRQPLVANNLQERLQFAKTVVRVRKDGRDAQSGLYVPIISKREILGVIQAQSFTSNRFSQDDAALLALIGNTAAIAIENARLFAETERRLQQLHALHSVDMAITGSLDLRVTLNILLGQVVAQLNVDAASVLLLDSYTQTLKYAALRGFRSTALQHMALRLGEGQAGKAALERQVVSIPDLRILYTPPIQNEASLSERSERGSQSVYRYMQSEGFVSYYATPLIAKGQVKGVLEIFHRERFRMEGEHREFIEAMATQAAIAIDDSSLFDDLQRSNVELTLAYDATLEGWSRALDLRDQDTEGHSQRVTELTLRLARAMGMTEAELIQVRRGSLLHDIGKMGIPDDILLKPGPLDEQEWEIMRRHPVYANELLAPVGFLRRALDIPYCHHEKWDGSGYPRGLKGEQIPLAARIFAVVDVWDALLSQRPYRPAWPEEKARQYLREQSGTHFDPSIVDIFLDMIA